MNLLCRAALLALLPGLACSLDAGTHAPPGLSVPRCAGITLTASYLAQTGRDAGAGFLFRLRNDTARPIELARPVPSSAHWYALVGNRWLWRASAGSGGSLVDAERPAGPLFAWRPAAPPVHPDYLVVAAHAEQEWKESMSSDPAIAYQPSCAMCAYPGEREYQEVFAYAYLPAPEEDVPDLLRCGLRSNPVPMPPMALHPAAK